MSDDPPSFEVDGRGESLGGWGTFVVLDGRLTVTLADGPRVPANDALHLTRIQTEELVAWLARRLEAGV